MYFADFRDNFWIFLTNVLFFWLKWLLNRPLSLKQILGNKWLQFCGYEALFAEKYDRNIENWNNFS